MTGIEIVEIRSEADMDAALAIRRAVFCREQGVPEALEIDGRDAACRHYLARAAGVAVGTARTRPVSGETRIERVAVLAARRGRGIGRALMERVIADIGRAPAALNAQCRTERFYARLGFVAEGDVFEEAGIPHVRMTRGGRARRKRS